MDMSKAARTTAEIIAQSEAAQDMQIRINDLTEALRHAQGDAEYYAERRLNATSKSAITRFYNQAMGFQAEAHRLESELADAKAALAALIREEQAAMMPTDQQNMRAAAYNVLCTYEKIDLRPYDGVSEAITNVYRKGPITIYISESAVEGGEIIEFLIERTDRAEVGTIDGKWYNYYHGAHGRGNWRRDLTPEEQAREASRAVEMKAAREGRPWGGPEVADFEDSITNAACNPQTFAQRWAKLAERSAVAPSFANMPENDPADDLALYREARAALGLGQWERHDPFSEKFAALPHHLQNALSRAQSRAACESYRGWEHDRDLDPDRGEDEYRDPDQDQWDREEAERAAMDGGYNRAAAEAREAADQLAQRYTVEWDTLPEINRVTVDGQTIGYRFLESDAEALALDYIAAKDSGEVSAHMIATATLDNRARHQIGRMRRQINRASRHIDRALLGAMEIEIVNRYTDQETILILTDDTALYVNQDRASNGQLEAATIIDEDNPTPATPIARAAHRLAFKLAAIKTAQARAAAQAGRQPSKVYILYSKKSQAARAALRNRFAH